MATPTHVVILPDRMEMFLSGVTTKKAIILPPIRQLNGGNWPSMVMFKLPRPGWPEDFTSKELQEAGQCYIQAGGLSDQMTVEIRRKAGDEYQQYAVGRGVQPEGEPELTNVIPVGRGTVEITDAEVFDAEEAADLFLTYCRTDDIPEGYSLRKIATD